MINIGWQLMRQLPKDLAPWKHLVIINYDYVPKFSLSCDDNLGLQIPPGTEASLEEDLQSWWTWDAGGKKSNLLS